MSDNDNESPFDKEWFPSDELWDDETATSAIQKGGDGYEFGEAEKFMVASAFEKFFPSAGIEIIENELAGTVTFKAGLEILVNTSFTKEQLNAGGDLLLVNITSQMIGAIRKEALGIAVEGV